MELNDPWFDNKPTLQCLFNELQPQLEAIESSSSESFKIAGDVKLSQNYSHQAIKRVLQHLGYATTSKKPGLEFRVFKI